MATFSIAGNVGTNGTVGEIVYIIPVGSYPPPQPLMTITDASKNYSFTGLNPGVYNVYTAANPTAYKQVILVGTNVSDVNFSS